MHVILRLVELPSELARGLGLPTGGEGPVFQRDSGEFESALRSAQSSGRVRILAEPQLVTTMGRKARLHVGGLDAEVCPHRYEAGELQLSVDVTKRISNEPLPVPAGPGKQTYPAQADLTLTPEKVAILPLDTKHDMDRWTYLLVQARTLHAGPLAAPTTDSYLPVPYVTPYAAAPAAPAAPPRAPDAPAPPTTSDPWPRKLPSEYFDQRQQIIADLTEQVRQSMQSGADEVEDVRLGFLVAQAESRLALLTREFDSQRHVYQSQLQAQQASLQLTQQSLERLEQMYRTGTVPESEVAQARVVLAQAQAACQQIENIVGLFQSSRDALATEQGISMIVDEFKRAAAVRRERLELERMMMEQERMKKIEQDRANREQVRKKTEQER